MPWICKECKKPIEKIVQPVTNQDRSPDIGEPTYRRQTYMGGKRVVVNGYCSPDCSLKDYERMKDTRENQLS